MPEFITQASAVNSILIKTGEECAQTLTSEHALSALNTLKECAHDILTQGWSFNTEKNLVLTPDTNKHITLPSNAYSVVIKTPIDSQKYTFRGRSLYDQYNHTNEFTNSITIDCLITLDFDDIPEIFKIWIMKRATRVYYEAFAPGGEALPSIRQSEEDAEIIAKKDENKQESRSSLSNSYMAYSRIRSI